MNSRCTSESKLLLKIYDCAVNPTNWQSVIDECVVYADAQGAMLRTVKLAGEKPDIYFSEKSKYWRELPDQQLDYLVNTLLKQSSDNHEQVCDHQKITYSLKRYACEGDLKSPDGAVEADQIHTNNLMVFRLNNNTDFLDIFILDFKDQNDAPTSSNETVAKRLVCHIAKSLQLSRTLSATEKKQNTMLAVYDQLSIGLCVVLKNGDIFISNATAKRIFQNSELFINSGNRQICACSELFNKKINAAIENAFTTTQRANSDFDQLVLMEAKNSHPVLIATKGLRHPRLNLAANVDFALISLIELSDSKKINTDKLSEIYEFTGAQKAVCALLTKGLTRVEIASIRNVSPETIKSQIAAIYRKTSTSDRAELLSLAVKTNLLVR